MKKTFNINLVIYFFFCTLFIVFTTNYLSEYDLINTFGQKDIEHYYFIAKEAPLLPKNQTNIMAHVSSRFAVPYIAGILSNLSGLDYLTHTRLLIVFFFYFFFMFFINFYNLQIFHLKGKFCFFL